MRGGWIIIAAFIAASAHAQAPQPRSDSLEIGVRYWLSNSGQTTRSIDASSVDPTLIHPAATGTLNPSSTTNYEQLDANVLELFARKRIDQSWFAKGNVGLGAIGTGTLIDETFFTINGEPFHTMTLSNVDGKLGYATLDIARELMRSSETAFAVFVGYQYWKEKLNANGYSDAFGTQGLPPDVLVATNEVRWNMLRLGGELQVTYGRTRFIVEAAWVPYAGYRNEAGYPLQPDLGPVVASGNGRGGTFEAEVRRSFPGLGGIDMGIGVRYWKMEAYNGNETAGGVSFPVVDLSSERYGFTFSVAKSW
jgi:hypothetical protein